MERRLLVAFACLLVALQAFLASLTLAHAFARMQTTPFAICHGGGIDEPGQQGSGDNPASAPCTLCAFALAGAGIAPQSLSLDAPLQLASAGPRHSAIIATSHVSPRAGLSRAPPVPA